MRHCQGRRGGYLSWNAFHTAIGTELAGHTLIVFATGDHLLIFYKHHLVRELTLDRSRRYQAFSLPRHRDGDRDNSSPISTPPRVTGQAPGLPAITAGPGPWRLRVKGGRRPSRSNAA